MNKPPLSPLPPPVPPPLQERQLSAVGAADPGVSWAGGLPARPPPLPPPPPITTNGEMGGPTVEH